VLRPGSNPSSEGLDENIVVVDGVSPDDLRDSVGSLLGASGECLPIESSHPPQLIFAEMELDGMSKLMAKDRPDPVRVSSEQLWGDDDADFPAAVISVTIGAEGHIASLGECVGVSHDKRHMEVSPNDALHVAV
jgi:hypothetical protein